MEVITQHVHQFGYRGLNCRVIGTAEGFTGRLDSDQLQYPLIVQNGTKRKPFTRKGSAKKALKHAIRKLLKNGRLSPLEVAA